jgi:hypothetical protein
MNHKGNCRDDVVDESFFATLRNERKPQASMRARPLPAPLSPTASTASIIRHVRAPRPDTCHPRTTKGGSSTPFDFVFPSVRPYGTSS